MRKSIISLLAAGVIAFVASNAWADANTHTGSFHEDHSNGTTLYPGAVTSSLKDASPEGDHYKVTNATEAGAHGKDLGGWQLDSNFLKLMADGTFDGDASWGYTTGANPFVTGNALYTDPDTLTYIMPAPAYTMPCPEWVATGGKGTCPANTDPQDPQTEVSVNIWDGTVLDDLYQVIGVDDSIATGEERILDQTLDQLFYSGKRGRVWFDADKDGTAKGDEQAEVFENGKIGTTTVGGTERIFNIDDTLDQDLADFVDNAAGTHGIFNKLTLIFQLAGKQLTEGDMNALGYTTTHGFGGGPGCSSWGGSQHTLDNGLGANDKCVAIKGGEALGGTTFYDQNIEDVDSMAIWNRTGSAGDNFSAVIIDQWVVSELYDWAKPQTGDNSKLQGIGVKQEYSSWFRDGTSKDYQYDYNYKGGHGKVNKTVTPGDHGTIDP